MSEEQIVPKRTILDKHMEKWYIFTGDCDIVNDYLEARSKTSIWVVLQYFNSLTRSFGQVIFANNPISGILVMLGVGIADMRALLAALATTSLSFLLALLLRQDSNAIYNGIFGYNPVLLGIVSVSLVPSLYPQVSVAEPRFWFFLTLATLLSIYVTSACMNFCRHLGQYPVPCFSLPFNIVQYLLLFCLLHNGVPDRILSADLIDAPSATSLSELAGFVVETIGKVEMNITGDSGVSGDGSNVTRGHLNWGKMFSGTIVSMSQVYGLNDIPCSIVMFLGLVIYSPTTAGFGYLGGLLGTILGQAFASEHEDIYNGVWGYNALLTSAALAGFCFVLTLHSALLTFSALVFTLVIHHVMNPLAVTLGVPVLSMPFNITSLVFNLVTSEGNSLVRPIVYSSPEKHKEQMLRRNEERKKYVSKSPNNEKWSDFGEV